VGGREERHGAPRSQAACLSTILEVHMKDALNAAEEAGADALARRGRAVVEADVGYLEGILLPRFRHVHSTGKVEPRETYLDSFRSGRARFSAVKPGDVAIDVYDRAAVAAGDIYIERMVDGAPVGR